MESLKVTNSRNSVKFKLIENGCFHDGNASAILESWSDLTKMKCAIECVRLYECVAWDWRITHHTHKVNYPWKTYDERMCRLLKWTPDQFEITKDTECAIYQLHRLSPVF